MISLEQILGWIVLQGIGYIATAAAVLMLLYSGLLLLEYFQLIIMIAAKTTPTHSKIKANYQMP